MFKKLLPIWGGGGNLLAEDLSSFERLIILLLFMILIGSGEARGRDNCHYEIHGLIIKLKIISLAQ